MTPGIYNFTIPQGTQFSKSFTWKNPDGSPIDLTGYVPRMQLRDTEKNLIIDLGAYLTLDALAGKTTLNIDETVTTPFDFDSANYDLKLYKAGATRRPIEGIITLDPQVTE